MCTVCDILAPSIGTEDLEALARFEFGMRDEGFQVGNDFGLFAETGHEDFARRVVNPGDKIRNHDAIVWATSCKSTTKY